MGLAKKMEWFKWIRKYSTGILDTKTGSMETLIDSASSKTINYAYTSSVIADDEFINAAAAPPHQRPMLPPPPLTSQDSPSPSLPNDDYDCCVSLDGIPIKHEFQYTLSDPNGCGKITKHDIEGLASKILESMYGTTLKFSSRGQRTVKVTLNVRQSTAAVAVDRSGCGYYGGDKQSSDKHYAKTTAEGPAIAAMPADGCPIYGKVPSYHRVKPGEQRYRRDQLIEMVQKSLAENLSFQNQRKSNKPESYHRTRTKRRQSTGNESLTAGVRQQQVSVSSSLPASPLQASSPVRRAVKSSKPASKVPSWSPYDFEPAVVTPTHNNNNNHHHHHNRLHEQLKNNKGHHNHHRHQQQQQQPAVVTVEEQVVKWLNQQQHRGGAVHANSAKDATTAEQTKNNHQRYKRAKLAAKKIHHHIHEHHHYHHYDYYIV